MAVIGTVRLTHKKVYLNGPKYVKGKEYWQPAGSREWLGREEFEDGLPVIPREDFLQELRALFEKYNASIDVSYEETCVLGDPMTTHVYVGNFEVLEIEGGGLESCDLII